MLSNFFEKRGHCVSFVYASLFELVAHAQSQLPIGSNQARNVLSGWTVSICGRLVCISKPYLGLNSRTDKDEPGWIITG